MPRLPHDLLHHLISQVPGVEMIDCPPAPAGIAEAAEQASADVVIADEADAGPLQACALFERMPHSRALALSHDGHAGVLYELRPHRRTIGELSADTVRVAVGAGAPCAELLSEPSTRPAP